MSFWVKTSTLAMGYGGVGGASYMVYDTVTPKTIGERLAWEGIVITDGSNMQVYKAIFEEQRSELKTDINTITDSTDLNTGANSLKSWCNEKVLVAYTGEKENVGILDKVKKRCVDRFETVKGRLIRLSENAEEILKTSDEDYKVIFALYKKDTTNNFIGFIKTIKSDSTVSDSTEATVGYSDLKEACEGYLKQKAEEVRSDVALQKIYWWCSPPAYKTVSQKLEKDGKEMYSQTTDFENQFETWKHTEQITSFISTESNTISSTTEKSQGGTAMKTKCEEQKSKKLYEEGIYPDIYVKVKSACVKNKTV